MRLSRWLLAPALALVLTSLPTLGADAAPKAADHDTNLSATPVGKAKVKLDKPARGAAALKALEGQLDLAAKANRMSVAKLAKELKNDPTAWIGVNGRLFYADKFERPTTSARTSATAAVPPATEPLASTFQLHSKAGSAHTVYLDFNGVTLTAGGWTLNGWKAGTYKGFSQDSDFGTFTDAERAYVQHVWRVVSEKYSPFDIDVTTQNPGADAYNRNGSGDLTYGDHVVFTDEATGSGAKPKAQCPDGCDGLAFKGTFNDPDDSIDLGEPTWVYTDYYNSYAGLAGEIAAHEVGHTLGLAHDGLGTGEGDPNSGDDAYYPGYDLWSPVMGNGIGALTQFSKGEYANASNTEDDFAVMQTYGVNLRADDWGDLATPSDLGTQSSYTLDGVIEDAADSDVFTVGHPCAAPLRVEARGIGAGQTIDLHVIIRSALDDSVLVDGNEIASANTSTFPRTPRGVDALAVNDPPMNSVKIQVEGVGQGIPTVNDGYSDYGSVGRYHLTISGCNGVNGATPGAPTGVTAVQTTKTGTLTLNWQAPASSGDSAVTGYRITGLPSGTVDVAASARSEVFTGLIPGTDYDIGIAAVNIYGAGTATQLTKHMASWIPSGAPTVKASAYGSTLAVSWTEPANPGHAIAQAWTIRVYVGSTQVDEFQTDYGYSGVKITGVGNNHYKLLVWLNYDADSGGTRGPIVTKTVDVGPSEPRIGTPSSGTSGGTATATARWSAPYALRGQSITSYTVAAYKLNSSNQVVKVYVSSPRKASARSYVWALPAGRYKFRVQAHATGGWTPISKYSTVATSK